MAECRDVLTFCDVFYICFTRVPWTFDNKQKGDRNVKVRLDRAVALTSWSSWFHEARLHHLVSSRSDHVPVLLELCRDESASKPPRIARYEIMWERDQTLLEEIRLAWTAGSLIHNLGDVDGNLKKLMACLTSLSHDKFGAVTLELEKLRKQLEDLTAQGSLSDKKDEEETRKQMDELLYKEEMMWLQRSHISWLREGGCNTKYFHCKVVSCAKKNKILRLTIKDGQTTKDRKEMVGMATDFLKKLYMVDPGVSTTEITHLFQHCISDETNTSMCKEFYEEEISDALFQIGPLKAPGPDGFPARFFQRNWSVLKRDVVIVVQMVF
jgi:hypothetical protein